NRRSAGPGHSPDYELAARDLLIWCRLSDQRANLLQCYGFSAGVTVTNPFVLVFLSLVIAVEWRLNHLDVGQPFHRGNRIPARDDKSKRVAMLNGQRLAVHGVGE